SRDRPRPRRRRSGTIEPVPWHGRPSAGREQATRWGGLRRSETMATTPRSRVDREVDYPTSDGRPMGETDLHRQDMVDVIEALKDHFAADPMVYVSGNLLLFYEEGNRWKHVAPDVFVVRGVRKLPPRDHYLLWK